MKLDKEKAVKLVIVLLVRLAAEAVRSVLVQTVLPFLIVGAGIYAGYRWALSEAPAPTADEVEEQARGIFSRFRRAKKTVEATAKVGEALADLGGAGERVDEAKDEKRHRRRRPLGTVAKGGAPKAESPQSDGDKPEAKETELSDAEVEAIKDQQVGQMKQSLENNPKGKIEFKDRDVVIDAKDFEQPDISRLEEKEKEEPEVTNNVLAQIEERRRRLQGGG
ncbi:MAG: hypothetical protein OXG23_17415 [Chloroflexi bacterium]|nr:hypothetical protein [Chloroflexota bacterium]